MKQRVIALMSGGVDSSVAAALLTEQGYDVIGVYILGWTGTKEFPCGWQQEEADARQVAKKIGIPFYTVNLSKEYETEVIDRFFAGYKAGLTPNPDILCNKEIKFKALWQAVRQFEPDFIATGHYARIQDGQITKPQDADKDQTYFLWGIDRAMLPRILFPLGELVKSEVRAMAQALQLPTATKKDSQGICFVGPLKVRQFLQSQISAQPGQAITKNGKVIATHQGVQFYTIGQRLGAGELNWHGDPPPLFVIAKDLAANTLVVGSDADVIANELEATEANWLSDLPKQFECLTKIRYRQEDVETTVTNKNGHLQVSFSAPVRAITSGQSIVFYSKTGQLLGGAIIGHVSTQDSIVREATQQAAHHLP